MINGDIYYIKYSSLSYSYLSLSIILSIYYLSIHISMKQLKKDMMRVS